MLRTLFVAVVALFVVSGVAEARPYSVKLSDLNMEVASDLDVAITRIERAAKRACRSERLDIAPTRREQRQCARDTVALVLQRQELAVIAARYDARRNEVLLATN